jgi:hypothetical protein
MEGWRERLPVQLARPRIRETDDPTLQAFYQRALKIGADPIFRAGQFLPFDSGTRGLISFVREHEGRRVLVAIDFRHGHALQAAHGQLSVPGVALRGLAPGAHRLRDLWTGSFRGRAQYADGRLLVDLDRSRTGLPLFVLEIL